MHVKEIRHPGISRYNAPETEATKKVENRIRIIKGLLTYILEMLY